MLVSHPAVGKTTAMDAGVDLLEKMKTEYSPAFRIIPNQTNEPAFIDMMKIIDQIPLPHNPNIMIPQSAGFFYASEASASALQNTCGDFVATLTAFYDCPKWFRKKLKSDLHVVEIENGCINLLAGSTFNYLKTLVNEQSVLGGFASRLIYIVHEDREVRNSKWGSSQELDSDMAAKLVEDLAHINRLVGPIKPTADFISAWEKWQPKFDQYLIDLNSERMEAIMSRKGTNLIKVAMLLSVSESDSLILTADHFERALALIEDAYKDNATIIAAAAMADLDSQRGLNQFLLRVIAKNGGTVNKAGLVKAFNSRGSDVSKLSPTIESLLTGGEIKIDSNGLIALNTDPDSQL